MIGVGNIMKEKSMMSKFLVRMILGGCLGFAALPVMAHEDGGEKSPLSKEEREKRAKAHENMATCLRSDKAMKECRAEMKEAHGGGHHMKGRGHRHGHGKHPKAEKTGS